MTHRQLVCLCLLACCVLPSGAAAEAPPLPPPEEQLFLALDNGDLREVSQLLDAGVDVNTRLPDGHGETPLMYAASTEMNRLLLSRGADPTLTDENGNTALHGAVLLDWAEDLLPLLIEAGANVDAASNHGMTPLFYSVLRFEGRNPFIASRVLHMLADFGANLDHTDIQGRTALMLASQRGLGKAVTLLIKLGADPNLRDTKGHTAHEYALFHGHADLAATIPQPKE